MAYRVLELFAGHIQGDGLPGDALLIPGLVGGQVRGEPGTTSDTDPKVAGASARIGCAACRSAGEIGMEKCPLA
jgi:hypothetical protein